MKLYTYDPKKDKPVLAGRIKDDTFYKTAKKNNFMIKLRAYGIQEDVIKSLKIAKVVNVIIKSKTEKLKSSLWDWIAYGNVQNYGHGNQRFLSVNCMRKIK